MSFLERGLQVILGSLALTLCTVPALAQDDLTQHTEAVSTSGPADADQVLFNLALGAAGNSGNTRAFSGNGGFTFLLRRKRHEFTLDGLGTMGWANEDTTTVDASGMMTTEENLEQNVGNFVGRARYDYYLTDRDTLFVAVVPRRDLFAGLKARVQVQAGYMRTLFQSGDTPEHRLWTELGGDATVDRYEPLILDDGTLSDPEDQEIYSARVFAGYTNRLNEAAEVNFGVEALLPPYNEEGEDGKYRYRINSHAELNSSLTDRFKLGFAMRVLFDSSPPAGTPSRFDTITTVQLVYSYDSLAGAPEEPACPPCEGTAEDEATPEVAAAPEEGEAPVAGEGAAPFAEASGAPVEPAPKAEVPPAAAEVDPEAPTADAEPVPEGDAPTQPETGEQ